MKAIFNAGQLAHNPVSYLSRGRMVGFPEKPERARRLLAGVRKAGVQLHAGRRFDDSHVLAVHEERYVSFLMHAHAEWSKMDGASPEVMASIRPVERPAAYPKDIVGRAGWHQMDFSCPLGPDTWKSARASANTALTAAQMVAEGEERVVYALCRPPGHHAFGDRAGGFCYLNNTAIAARYMQPKHGKVAVLDIDVHHGNGTQGIFYYTSDVLTVSVHADPAHYYPFFYGDVRQRGAGEGEGYNINIPVAVKADDKVWTSAVDLALKAIGEFGPGALVIALGLDAHEADPLAGGAVTTKGFGGLAQRIAALGLPTVIVQEGGYLTPYLDDNLASFLTGFMTAK